MGNGIRGDGKDDGERAMLRFGSGGGEESEIDDWRVGGMEPGRICKGRILRVN